MPACWCAGFMHTIAVTNGLSTFVPHPRMSSQCNLVFFFYADEQTDFAHSRSVLTTCHETYLRMRLFHTHH